MCGMPAGNKRSPNHCGYSGQGKFNEKPMYIIADFLKFCKGDGKFE